MAGECLVEWGRLELNTLGGLCVWLICDECALDGLDGAASCTCPEEYERLRFGLEEKSVGAT